jgi:hypothetical protein
LIPSSLLGLTIFVVLLAPGLAYVLRHEVVVPARSYSAFRETLRVVFASVLCLTVVALIFTGFRWLFPNETINIGALVHNPRGFARENYVELAWAALTLVGSATVLGALAADPRIIGKYQRMRRKGLIRFLTGWTDQHISHVSAWYRVMHIYDDSDAGPVHVGAQMDDGSYFEGRVFSLNTSPDEDADRELLLHAPLRLTTANGLSHDIRAQFTVISARHIVRLDVTHLPKDYVDRRPERPQGLEDQSNVMSRAS